MNHSDDDLSMINCNDSIASSLESHTSSIGKHADDEYTTKSVGIS